jgi:hypothetical protein
MAGFDDHQHEPTLKQLSSRMGLATDAPHHAFRAPSSHHRSFREWLNDYAAREGIVTRLLEWSGDWLVVKHPRAGAGVACLAGAVGAGYSWAAIFGDGIRGGRTGPALDNAPSYPNADAAAVGAIALVGLGCLLLLASVSHMRGGHVSARQKLACLVLPAAAGLMLFLLSRLFV